MRPVPERQMKRRLHVLLALVGLGALCARAQYDVAFGNYWALQAYYNPAASGIDGLLDVKGAYSMQLSGFENAPATMYAGVDLPLFFLSPKHGAGVGFLNDNIGLFSHKKFYLQYAFHQKLWGGRLSAGLRLGLLNETFDGTKLDVEQSGDPAFPTAEANGSGFDLDAGIRYTHKRWYVGFSAMHCTAPTVMLGEEKVNEISISPVFYLSGGYNIKLKNPLYIIHTSALLRTDMQAWRGDVTARVAYHGSKHRLYGGVGYSPTNSVSLLIGGDFHGVSLGYSYEMYTSAIGPLNGSHELVIGYEMDLNVFKKGKNKHKSVRIL